MAIQKEHKEFYKVDLDRGWENLPGYPDGIRQQVLAGFLDEKKKRHSHASRDCTRDEVGSDSRSPCAARAQSSLVHRVSSIDDLPAFAGEETTEPCVSATTVDVSSGRQPTLPW